MLEGLPYIAILLLLLLLLLVLFLTLLFIFLLCASRLSTRQSKVDGTLDMSLTWLIVRAMIGVIGGLRTGRLVELASGVLGGMIVLPIAGALLGLTGGDAKGSVVGAVGGLMDCSPCRRRRRRFRGWSPGLLIFLFSLAILALERLMLARCRCASPRFLSRLSAWR